MQKFDYNSNLLILKSNQIGVILMTIAVIDTPRDSCDVCFRTFVLMTRFSGVDDNFINKPQLVQDETIRRTKTCKHCCGDRKKSGMADTMVGQHSGPALAGPAAPAMTALCANTTMHR